MADVWVDERAEHGKWKVTSDDGDVRYVSTNSLEARKNQLEEKLRQLETQRQREQLRIEAEITQIDADLVEIATREAE